MTLCAILLQNVFNVEDRLFLDYNLEALDLGLHLADEMGIKHGEGIYRIEHTEPEEHLLLMGNESSSFWIYGSRRQVFYRLSDYPFF